jgi:outer membrane immunogenic protein
MRKFVLTGVALGVLIASPALAADLRVKAPAYKAPLPVAAYSWTGCYLGAHIGGAWVRKDAVEISFGSLGGHDADGGLGGFQGGCNYQVGVWVIGIQGDYAWTDVEGSHTLPVSFLGPGITGHSEVRSLASLTGRIGYGWDRFLGYVKFGVAWERDKYRAKLNGETFSEASESRDGWTIGIGGEYAFTESLSAFIEYNWYDFGTGRNTFVSPFGTFVVDIEESKSVLKGGINWRFGWGPLVARY